MKKDHQNNVDLFDRSFVGRPTWFYVHINCNCRFIFYNKVISLNIHNLLIQTFSYLFSYFGSFFITH
ncbi:hypothetical protein [Gottfriedia luciferensis]|uniref:hypothetical protein n=1 Tax=Gottfriedia luciferensis TaxID=178774 RepID=UPI001155249D|nr:hypothetical protein [Gottfriedia luciferensis]